MEVEKQIVSILNALIIGVFVTISICGADDKSPSRSLSTAEAKYPGLFNGVLRSAIPDPLPPGELLVSGKLKITQKQLDDEIRKAPADLREQLKQWEFFVLEQMAMSKLLVSEAQSWAESKKMDTRGLKDNELIDKYLTDLTSKIAITTEEAKKFFDSNPEMFGGVKFSDIQSQLRDYLLTAKKQDFVEEYINEMGKRVMIRVNDSWAKLQHSKAINNPVEKARRSGKPSFINFGATGCVPCDMMAPIREEIKREYAGKLNVEFINVRKDRIMGARYGISSIPTQVFYDKNGKEVYRHTGFWAKDKIIEKLSELGIKK